MEQALQVRFIMKYGKEKANQRKNLANNEKSSKNSKNRNDSTKKDMNNKYVRKKVDMKDVQYYNCQGLGPYTRYY